MPNAKVPYKGTYIPPAVASRTSQAPFLFKCCRVGYDKETNRLEIRKGEYVGKKISTELGSLTNEHDSEDIQITVDVVPDEYDDLSGESSRYVTNTENGAEKVMFSSNLLQLYLFHSTNRLKENKENDLSFF